MIVDADSVEAGILATRDERCDLEQGPTDRNPERDAEPAHRTNAFIASCCMPSMVPSSAAL